jgi:hypothetical protein
LARNESRGGTELNRTALDAAREGSNDQHW